LTKNNGKTNDTYFENILTLTNVINTFALAAKETITIIFRFKHDNSHQIILKYKHVLISDVNR